MPNQHHRRGAREPGPGRDGRKEVYRQPAACFGADAWQLEGNSGITVELARQPQLRYVDGLWLELVCNRGQERPEGDGGRTEASEGRQHQLKRRQYRLQRQPRHVGHLW